MRGAKIVIGRREVRGGGGDGVGAGRPVWEEMLRQSLGGADGRQEGQARLGVAQAGHCVEDLWGG